MMAGIMIPNFVISIGDAFTEQQKNSNVLVEQLGIIMQIVVIGLIVLTVHVQKKPHLNHCPMIMMETKVSTDMEVMMMIIAKIRRLL